MIVGVLSVEIYIPASASLKEKRKVIKSVKDRIHNKFNASVAEVDYTDKWQRSLLAIAVVSDKNKFVQEVLNKIFDFLDREPAFEITKYNFDYR